LLLNATIAEFRFNKKSGQNKELRGCAQLELWPSLAGLDLQGSKKLAKTVFNYNTL
jgi:hypothetical protein